jgi:hypothetical protein
MSPALLYFHDLVYALLYRPCSASLAFVALFARRRPKPEAGNPSEMAADGMQAFFDDLQVDPAGVLSLAIAWRLDCKQMGVITRAEFVKAYSAAGCVQYASMHLYACHQHVRGWMEPIFCETIQFRIHISS